MTNIKTTPAAIKAMAAGPDEAGKYDEAKRFLWSAINYYCKTDTMYEGMTLDDWIAEGDWHFKAGKLPTAKQLAADYDAR